jgi:hypothetical protein
MDKPADNRITILTSLVGYGAFIPALMLYRHLVRLGHTVSLDVIEKYYSASKQQTFEATKTAFQKNAKLAKIASGLSGQFEKNTDASLLQPLLQLWETTNTQQFVCFSGLWCDTMADYVEQAGADAAKIIFCKVDSGFSSAWKSSSPALAGQHFTSFFDATAGTVQYKLMPPGVVPAIFNERENSLLVHGGGWGLGNYNQLAGAIPNSLYKKYIVQQPNNDTALQSDAVEAVLATHQWNPLHNSDDFYQFPSYATSSNPQHIHYGLWQLINQCKAIVSKPGGMTLMDSLVTATPLVMLEPAGKNEEDNAKLWQQLGLGIYYADWQGTGFDEAILAAMHTRLLQQLQLSNNFYTFIEQQFNN